MDLGAGGPSQPQHPSAAAGRVAREPRVAPAQQCSQRAEWRAGSKACGAAASARKPPPNSFHFGGL